MFKHVFRQKYDPQLYTTVLHTCTRSQQVLLYSIHSVYIYKLVIFYKESKLISTVRPRISSDSTHQVGPIAFLSFFSKFFLRASTNPATGQPLYALACECTVAETWCLDRVCRGTLWIRSICTEYKADFSIQYFSTSIANCINFGLTTWGPYLVHPRPPLLQHRAGTIHQLPTKKKHQIRLETTFLWFFITSPPYWFQQPTRSSGDVWRYIGLLTSQKTDSDR